MIASSSANYAACATSGTAKKNKTRLRTAHDDGIANAAARAGRLDVRPWCNTVCDVLVLVQAKHRRAYSWLDAEDATGNPQVRIGKSTNGGRRSRNDGKKRHVRKFSRDFHTSWYPLACADTCGGAHSESPTFSTTRPCAVLSSTVSIAFLNCSKGKTAPT